MTMRDRWYRPRNIAAAVVVAIVLIVVVAACWAYTAQPGRSVDYGARMVEISEAAQAATEGKENAWPLLMEIAQLRNTLNDEIAKAAYPPDFLSTTDPASPPEVLESSIDAMAYMKQCGLFDKLAQLARSERFVQPKHDGDLLESITLDFGPLRDIAKMNVARMHLANRAGDRAERLAAFEQNLVIVRALASQPIMVSRLVGISIASLTLGELRSEMTSARFSADELAELLDAMDHHLGPVPPLSVMLNGERLLSLDTIQWTHTDNGHGDGTMIYSKVGGMLIPAVPRTGWLGSHRIVNVIGLLYPSKADSTAKVNEFFDNAMVSADLPRSQRDAHPFKVGAFVDNLPGRYVLVKNLLASIDLVIAANDMYLTDIAGVRTMIAVEMYRARYGRLPQTLSALVPEILPSLPIDPFSGAPFGYRLVDDPASDRFGRGYLLYSVGLDGQDDRGTPSTRANTEALKSGGEGSDYIINTRP
ncbi:MAG: hypothetical protein KF745_04875 [Phycisphaeraceae bacterium]|nr:hypothetical protein [Phycisphaeraceae bacterium]